MNRHLGGFPWPLSVSIPFMIVLVGCGIAVYPLEDLRRFGWAAALVGIAALLLGLTKMLSLGLTENRIQFMTRIARDAIEYAESRDLDAEWKRIND